MRLAAYPQSRSHLDHLRTRTRIPLAAHERAAGDEVVQRADDLHVRVEVKPAVLVEDLEARVVRD